MQVPSHQKDIHSFFLPNFAHNKTTTLDNDDVDMDDPIGENDWRAYFDESDSPNAGPSEVKERRASKVPIHEALHSVKAHRVQFTYAWLSLLRYIKNSPQLSSRVLAILHRSVMPHLTRPVLLMDWIVACVDFGKHRFDIYRICSLTGLSGGSIALLALNTLFILIRDHNLCVFCTSNARDSQYSDLYSGTIPTFTLVSTRCSTAQYCTSAIAHGSSACWNFFCPPRTVHTSACLQVH